MLFTAAAPLNLLLPALSNTLQYIVAQLYRMEACDWHMKHDLGSPDHKMKDLNWLTVQKVKEWLRQSYTSANSTMEDWWRSFSLSTNGSAFTNGAKAYAGIGSILSDTWYHLHTKLWLLDTPCPLDRWKTIKA